MAHHAFSGQKLAIWIGSIAVAIVCVTGLGLKLHWDSQYGTRQQRKASHLQWRSAVDQRANDFRKVFDSLVPSNLTAQQIASQLGGNVQVLPMSAWGAGQLQWVVDPVLGVGIRLVYDQQGQIIGSSCCGAPTTLASSITGQPNLPDRKPVEERFQEFKRLLVPPVTGVNLPVSIVPWLGLLVLAWVFHSARHLLLAAAFWLVALTGLFVMMAPSHHLLTDTFSNDPLFWVTLMLFLTVGGVIWEKIESRPDPTACLSCGYTLKANTTGICPECGEAIPETQREYLRQ